MFGERDATIQLLQQIAQLGHQIAGRIFTRARRTCSCPVNMLYVAPNMHASPFATRHEPALVNLLYLHLLLLL